MVVWGPYALLLLDLLRAAGVAVPLSWFDVFWLTWLAGETAAGLLAPSMTAPNQQKETRIWFAIVALAATCMGTWWYVQASQAYDHFLYGFPDFGHYARRLGNTLAGRGFLIEANHLPRFWDHFNPGLGMLVPLWSLWPSAKLFAALQAVGLSLGAPLVYAIGVRLGATSRAAALWAAAYLLCPYVGQLNLSGFYGWHPVTMSVPLLLLAIWCLLNHRRSPAILACLVASSFEETVVFVMASMLLTLATERLFYDRFGLAASPLARGTGKLVWLSLAVGFVVAFAFIVRFSGFAEFQSKRLSHLGSSPVEIILSPFTRAEVFWPLIFRSRNLAFILALLLPMGLFNFRFSFRTLLAVAPPLGILMVMDEVPTSFGLHYATTFIPILFLAAMEGPLCQRRRVLSGEDEHTGQEMNRVAVRAAAGSALAAAFFGNVPWSTPTLLDVYAKAYTSEYGDSLTVHRQPGTPGNAILREATQMTNQPTARVLATGRAAAHLLRAERLELVSQMDQRWDLWSAEVGTGQHPLLVFDWILLDTAEEFHQRRPDVARLIVEAKKAGFEWVLGRHDVLLLKRPTTEDK